MTSRDPQIGKGEKGTSKDIKVGEEVAILTKIGSNFALEIIKESSLSLK
jgi:hypothetical protein